MKNKEAQNSSPGPYWIIVSVIFWLGFSFIAGQLFLAGHWLIGALFIIAGAIACQPFMNRVRARRRKCKQYSQSG